MRTTRFLIMCAVCITAIACLVSVVYVLSLMLGLYLDILLTMVLCLWGGSFLFSIAAILLIFIKRTHWLGLIPLVLCVLISGFVIYNYIWLDLSCRKRAEALEKISVERYLMRLRNALFHYAENNSGYLPEANSWCDLLM